MDFHSVGKRLIGAGLMSALLPVSGPSGAHAPWFGGPPRAQVVKVELPGVVRVSLLRSRHTVTIGCTGPYAYAGLKKGKPVVVAQKKTLKLKGSRKGLLMGDTVFPSGIHVTPHDPDSRLTVNGRPYRGTLVLKSRGGAVHVIETVALEEYLYGVLPREVGVDWPAEALKAQAVISRTYVVANVAKYASSGSIPHDDTFQVYGGYQDEHPASNKAVDDTRGEILADDQGAPVQTFFHSSCGGRTEDPHYVWQELRNPPEYLASTKDNFCRDDPFNNWEFEISAEGLKRRLRKAHYRVGDVLRKVTVAQTSPSGRACLFEVESSKGTLMIPGNSFRIAVGSEELRSTLLTTIKKRGKVFRFEGHGWGHGVGLCQWGARGRALAGQSYVKILGAYYPHTRLVRAGKRP